MKQRELEEFVNQLANQHQLLQESVNTLTERVNNLEILRARVGVDVTEEGLKQLKQANKELMESIRAIEKNKIEFCGSQ